VQSFPDLAPYLQPNDAEAISLDTSCPIHEAAQDAHAHVHINGATNGLFSAQH
jgi:hypothetical protein